MAHPDWVMGMMSGGACARSSQLVRESVLGVHQLSESLDASVVSRPVGRVEKALHERNARSFGP